jgi:hypothetical protein
MSWDPTKQYTLTMLGLTWEFGLATIASNSVEVTTRLKRVLAAFMLNSAVSGTSDSTWCDRTITNGAVTLESDFDGEVQYLFIGY